MTKRYIELLHASMQCLIYLFVAWLNSKKIYGVPLTMAPAASNTITRNLKDFHINPQEYDKIITGDLGVVGSRLLHDLLEKEGIDITSQHMDCGVEIFDDSTQNTNSGGSGCGCSAAFLSAAIIPKLQYGEWKKVLFVPTGALLSPVSSNEGQSIPGIAHAVVLEAVK